MSDNTELHGSPAGKRFFYGYIIVAVSAVILALAFGARTIFGIFFKPMAGDFDWTRAMTSGAFSLSVIIEGITGIVMGFLNDRIGPRVVLTICGVFIGVGFFLMSVIGSLWQFYLVYGLVVGIGMGGVFVPLVSTVARWFVKRRTLMTAIVVSGIGVGNILLPPFANWLIESYDWRRSYFILAVLILVIVVIGAWFLRRDPSQKGTMPYGADTGEPDAINLGTTGYTLIEALMTPQFWMAYLVFFCWGIAAFAFNPHFVPHLTDLGISAGNAAAIVSATGLISIPGSLLLGNVADRIGNTRVFAIGLVGAVIYYFGLVPARDLWSFYLLALLCAFCSGGAGASESPLVAGLFGMKSHGLIYGVVGSGFTLGAAVGPLMMGYLYDKQDNYKLALIICAVISILGMITVLLIRPVRGKPEKGYN